MPHMNSIVRWALLLAAPLLSLGCVERSYTIKSDPPAAVYRNGEFIGTTPVSENFVYYGDYNFVLVAEGYEPLDIKQNIPRPWYQYPFIDFVFEHLIPYPFKDRHEIIYQLQSRRHTDKNQLLHDAEGRRAIGKTLGEQPTGAPPEGMPLPEMPR